VVCLNRKGWRGVRERYEDLHLIQQLGWDRALGLRVVDVETKLIESAELIAARIRKALETFPTEKLIINWTVGCATCPPMWPERSWYRW
jgi:5-methyltetrahydropteroyltriglutamate--homocysteine methyltransferase